MAYEAKMITDSICNGQRLTTMQLTHPRIVHSEFMTHCAFARNASSSRAIPFTITVQRVSEDPFIPVWWGENQKGMQAADEIADWKKEKAIALWLKARDQMMIIAEEMAVGLNIHKQIVNRLLEPFSWITVAVTGDAEGWSNYFALRCHKDAQPEIQKQAYMAQLVYFKNEPEPAAEGMWHTPYVDWVEQGSLIQEGYSFEDIVKISTGRTARTSYLTQEGKRDPKQDIELHDRLSSSVPKHMSPFEHVCQAVGDSQRYGKYRGWKAYRHMVDNEFITDFKPNHPELI